MSGTNAKVEPGRALGGPLPTAGAGGAAALGTDDPRALGQTLGIEITVVQAAALRQYLDLLKRWNATYNLTSVRDPAAMFTQHLADCLAVVPPLRRQLGAGVETCRVLDVGSGGGLPGVVLAVVLPELQVLCVDAVGKKAAFVRQVAGNLALNNLKASHSRVEALRVEPFHLITSRAFSSLADFVRLTRGHLLPNGAWMAMKGRLPEEEIAALPADIEVFHVEQLNVPGLDAQRCLVWMRLKAND
jgi:16S rRNA (guanine527-N7)-methyltransferase